MGRIVTILHGGAYDDLGVVATLEQPTDEVVDIKALQQEWFDQIPYPFDLDGWEWEIQDSFIQYLISAHGWKIAVDHTQYNMGYEGIEQIKKVKDTFTECPFNIQFTECPHENGFGHIIHAIIEADGTKVWKCLYCSLRILG